MRALCAKNMSTLRNPDIRARDIRKLVSCKSPDIIWDKGCDDTSEWVMASIEDEKNKNILIDWLLSKKVSSDNEAILIKSDWKNPKNIQWGKLVSNPGQFFGNDMFQLYDIDLNWLLEYQVLGIARFGRYGNQNCA